MPLMCPLRSVSTSTLACLAGCRDSAAASMNGVYIPGDEIMVVFAAEKIRDMGYDDPRFSAVRG